MLSDEEKKNLLKKLQYCELEYQQDGYLSVGKFEAIKQAIEVIEKQSKEIEELKNADLTTVYLNGFYDGENKVEDKIKAKIEGLQEDIKYSANPLSIDNSKFGIKVLQSLLEKVGENNGTTEQMH